MKKKLMMVIIGLGFIGLLFFVAISSLVSANSNCPDSKKICLEYGGTICKSIEDESYKNCMEENQRLQEECLKNKVGCCVKKYCSQSQRCESECLKQGCEGDKLVSVVRSVVSSEELEEPTECNTCPLACKLKDPNNSCGECICPLNYGFCTHETGVRKIVNNTAVYCIDGLWLEQKQDNQTCQNSFECVSNFCSKGKCYDISKQVEENKTLLQKILNLIKRLFHI